MAEQRRWGLILEVEAGWSGEYPPPLPNELEAELQAALGERVQVNPSVLDDGNQLRRYRLEADATLSGGELRAAIIRALQDRFARGTAEVAMSVQLRASDGEELSGEAVSRPS